MALIKRCTCGRLVSENFGQCPGCGGSTLGLPDHVPTKPSWPSPDVEVSQTNRPSPRAESKTLGYSNAEWAVSGVLFLVCVVLFFAFRGGKDDVQVVDEPPRQVVINSGWDGSVLQVRNFLKETLKDPDSYEGIEWSKVVERPDGSFAVRHRYRAKNSFGGYVVEEHIFILTSSGEVLGASSTGK